MKLFWCLCILLLSGCGGGGEATRWIGADNRIVSLESIPFQVIWVRDSTGIDMRSIRLTPIVIMPDAMIERRRATAAAMIVGTDLCGGNASVVAEMKEGDINSTRIKCG
jgi:hypothetical protein